MKKGFGLIGLIITLAIIALLVFGAGKYMARDKNQIQAGKDVIDAAEDAARLQNENSLYLQNQIADPPPVNYGGVRDKLKNINK